MKAKRLLFLVMAICLANGVKAQFYDSADDIYYYVSYENGEYVANGNAAVFNFDGEKAFNLSFDCTAVKKVKQNLLENPNYYEDRMETLDYNLVFVSSNSSNTIYRWDDSNNVKFIFSNDRSFMTRWHNVVGLYGSFIMESHYKKVDKSYFKSGRSRTPSGTMYE